MAVVLLRLGTSSESNLLPHLPSPYKGEERNGASTPAREGHPNLPLLCKEGRGEVELQERLLLQSYGTEQRFRKGNFIFYEDHRPIGVYIHESGRIAFLRGEKEVSECLQPCVLGLQTVLSGARHPFSARAEEDVCVTFISQSALLSSVRHDFQNS